MSQLIDSTRGSDALITDPLVGKQFIDFELIDSNGVAFRLSSNLNNPTLLVFSNHLCSACQKMYPNLRHYILGNPDVDIIIITPNTQDENADFYRTMFESIPNVHVLQGTQETFILYGVYATPTLFSLNAEGQIVHTGSIISEEEIVELMQGTR